MSLDEPRAFNQPSQNSPGTLPGPDAPNTPAQIAFHEAQEATALEESTWPTFKVVITGDEVEWVPRNDERYWQLSDPDDTSSEWVSKTGEPVIMTAKATVVTKARSEEMAKMKALRDNPGYHTVESVEEMET